MRHKLRWMAGVAILTLLCIIGLQLFWLRTSYVDQERRFLADANNTLITTQVRESMKLLKINDTSAKGRLMATVLPDIITEIVKKANSLPDVDMNSVNLKGNVKLDIPDSMLEKYPALRKLDSVNTKNDNQVLLLGERANGHADDTFDLAGLKAAYIKALNSNGVAVDCELATLDSLHRIVQITGPSFKGASVRTSPDNRVLTDAKNIDYVQAAFPAINWYLLQRMLWVLVISIVLIVICLSSFFYLIAQFFRQKRLSEIRNDFMNNMTHELKTPISSVSVALELIDDAGKKGATDAVKEYIDIAQGELNRLTMLVEKVLKMAAFEKSDIKIAPESFLGAPWLLKITNSFKPIFETGGVVCETEISPELLMICADKTHLTNVLQNLIDNAVKYNDKARPMLKIRLQEEPEDITIIVADNGKGIPDAYLDKIFDKFFRVPAGNLHDVKGYGLGLSYIKAVVDLHHGKITVNSSVGLGSTFIITLPKESRK